MDQVRTTNSAPARRRRPAWRRWSLRLALLLAIYTVLGFLVIPLIARSVAVSQLRKLLDREVVIEQVRLNPFTFVAEIDGFAITDPDGEPLLAWRHVRVDFQFTSIFHGPYRVHEITVVEPAVRAQINPDYSYNFSDLLEKFSPTGKSESPDIEPSALPAIVIDSFEIRDAAATYADLTTSTPFRRRVYPVVLRAPGFSTAPGQTNTFELRGAVDTGAEFSFTGSLQLTPPELRGRLDLQGLNLTNYSALYQDFVRFEIRDGSIALRTEPHLRFDSSEPLAQAAHTRFELRGLKVGLRDTPGNLAELDQLSVDIPSADAWKRDAHVGSVLVDGVRLQVHRRQDATIELLEAAKPAETTNAPPGSAQLVFTAFTNTLALVAGNTNVGVARLDAFLLTNASIQLLDDSLGQPVRATVSDIAAGVQNVTTLPDAAPTAQFGLRWQTNGPLAIALQARVNPPTLEVSIDLEHWDLSVADAYLADFADARLEQAELSVRGRAHLEAPPGVEPAGKFEGELHLAKLKTRHRSNDAELLLWDDLNLLGLSANLHPLDVAIDQVRLAGLQLWATLLSDGTVNLLTAANITNAVIAPPGSAADAPPPDAATPPTGPATVEPTGTPMASSEPLPPLYVRSVLLTNAVLYLADELTTPNARFTVNPLHGVLTGLSSTNLQSGDFQFTGKIEPAGSFKIQGQVRPLDGPDPTRVDLSSQDIDLTPTDPYVQHFLGYELDRGAVSTDLHYTITQYQLQGSNHIVLDQFTLGGQVESPDAIKAPIKLGLKILKDREGRIELNVPVAGSIDDPQFNISKVITDAFANLFAKVLTSPFSMLGGLVGGGDQEELDRLEFKPGETTLDPNHLQHTRKIEKILYERPALTLELLGSADPDRDAEALRQSRSPAQSPTPAEPEPEFVPEPEPQFTPATPGASAGPAKPDPGPLTDDEYARALAERFIEARSSALSVIPSEGAPTESLPENPPVPAVAVSEDDLRQLAQQRAEAVRAAILESGRIEPERVTLKELAGLAPTGTAVRLSLQ